MSLRLNEETRSGVVRMDDQPEPQSQSQEDDAAKAAPQQSRLLDSADLLRGGNEVVIHHKGQYYRLRETRNGKLILGK